MFKLRGPKKREKRRPNFRDKVASKLNKKGESRKAQTEKQK